MAAHKAEKFGLEDRRVVISLSQVAEVYAGQGKYVEAEPVYLRALKVYRTVHGEFQANVATTLKKLGILHCMYGLYAQAEPLLTRALAIKEKLLGLDHSDVALSVVNLAQLRVVPKSSRRKRDRCTVDPCDPRAGAGAVPSRGRDDAGGPCQGPAEIRACRRGSLAGTACQKLSREAELNRLRHPV